MNYLKELTTRINIAMYGYKTPKSVIEKLPDYKYLIQNPKWRNHEKKATQKTK